MNLILTEWLGADGKAVDLSSNTIADLNFAFCFPDKSIFEKINKKKYYSILTTIKNFLPIKIKDYPFNAQQDYSKDYFKTIFDDAFLKKTQELIETPKIEDTIQYFVGKINEKHYAKFGEKANPVCEFIFNNGQVYVKTYQYAAEFEIPIDKSGKEYLKIKIEPRNLINKRNFQEMLKKVFGLQTSDSVSGKKTNSFLLLYYYAFVGRVHEVLRRGVYREYVEKEDNLYYLKERLLIAEHIRLNYFTKDKLYCGFTEFSTNNFINQTICQTLTAVYKAVRHPELNSQIRRIQQQFIDDEVLSTPVDVNRIKNISYNRFNKHYEEIMNFCYYILQNIGSTFGPNEDMKYKAYYIDMNELFENYVGKLLAEHNKSIEGIDAIWKTISGGQNDSGYYVENQNVNHYHLDDKQVFTIKPDFLIKDNNNKVVAVVDTKYKKLYDRSGYHYGIQHKDVYQVISYAYRFNTDKIFLVYPMPRTDAPDNLMEFQTQPEDSSDTGLPPASVSSFPC